MRALSHHLTPEELIDALERPLAPARQEHAATCADCRAERARLDTLVHDVGAVDVPEPSPLFWDHLSARIHERIALEPAPAARGPWTVASLLEGARLGWWPRWVMAGAVLALCTALGWMTLAGGGRPSIVPRTENAAVSRGGASTNDPDATRALDGTDDEWTVMEHVAESVAWDDDADGASMFVKPATVEYALNELSPEERRALVDLLRAEMARPPS